MRFCVNGRQPFSVIKKADEIKFQYSDRDRIMDLVEKFPEKTIILEVPGDEAEWPTWHMYKEKFAEFYIALHNLNRAEEFNSMEIKWYWPYPITSFYELSMVISLKPSYLFIGPPLTFDLDRVATKAYNDNSAEQIPLRMVVDSARPSYLPQNTKYSGVRGQWVRPEDCNLYATRINCFEFKPNSLRAEECMLDTYRNQKWPGNLNMLIENLEFDVDNRAIPEELGERRMNCGQRCWSGSACCLCERALKFAEAMRKEKITRAKEANIDN